MDLMTEFTSLKKDVFIIAQEGVSRKAKWRAEMESHDDVQNVKWDIMKDECIEGNAERTAGEGV